MQALRRHPGSSQRELAVLTGLDKATVSAVTSQLVDAGLVARSNATAPVRRLGRPAVALTIPRSAGIVFGVRLEPDRIAVVAADLGGRSSTASRGPARRIRAPRYISLAAAVAKLRQRIGAIPVRAMGIGVPALIERSGHLIFGPNLGWRDVPLATLAAEILPIPFVIENDANAAAIAEREFGSCAGVDDFIYVSGHSGVGGAIFAGGRLYRGAEGLAGEFGHIRIVPGGRSLRLRRARLPRNLRVGAGLDREPRGARHAGRLDRRGRHARGSRRARRAGAAGGNGRPASAGRSPAASMRSIRAISCSAATSRSWRRGC